MRPLHVKAFLGCAAITAAAIGALAPAVQSLEPGDGPVLFSLEADDQPHPHHPELDKLKERAKANGVSLGQQLRTEFGKLKKVSDSDFPDASIDGIHAMRFADLEMIAKAKRLTLEQAIEDYEWEAQFTELGRYIASKYPDAYAGYGIREIKGVRRGWVAFKDDVPQDVIDEARKVPAPIDFEGRKGFSEKGVQAKIDATVTSLKGKSGQYAVSADPFTGEIQVDADASAEDDDGWLRGGGYLDKGLPTQCTSGFNIEKDGVYSPMTAGHCVPAWASSYPMTYELHWGDGSSTTSVYSKLRHIGAYGDFSRFGAGSMSATDTFYTSWNVKRYVTRVRPYSELTLGLTVCKFGTKTGSSCTTIRNRNVSVTTDSGSASRLISTEQHITDGGDSGGPWYYGGEAVGITKGHYYDAGVRSLFSRADLVPSALNGWKIRVH